MNRESGLELIDLTRSWQKVGLSLNLFDRFLFLSFYRETKTWMDTFKRHCTVHVWGDVFAEQYYIIHQTTSTLTTARKKIEVLKAMNTCRRRTYKKNSWPR